MNLRNWSHNGQWLGLLLHIINIQKQQNEVNYILLAIPVLHLCPMLFDIAKGLEILVQKVVTGIIQYKN